MRRRALVVLAPVATLLVVACWGLSIDVGSTNADAAAAADAPEVTDALDARDAVDEAMPDPLGQCGVSGQVDRYFTAKELSDRLMGRWGQCPGVQASPLPCLPKTPLAGIRFSPDGTFAVLGAQSEHAEYVDQPEACGRGTFRFQAPVPGDGGVGEGGDADASQSEYVAFDDTALHNGLQVHLFTEAGPLDVELVEFEKGPERMFLREEGPFDSRGYFARLPAAPR